MKKSGYLLLFLSLAIVAPGFGQLQLLIEKSGNPRSERLKVYDEFTFQLKDDDTGWYTRQILDMDANGQLLYLGDTWISLNDIARIRLKRQRAIPNIIGGALQGGGATMILGDLWYTLRGNHRYTDGGIEFGFVNIAVGTALRTLLGPIKYRLGGNKRLRVIDLTF
jgi:hypothetical protein